MPGLEAIGTATVRLSLSVIAAIVILFLGESLTLHMELPSVTMLGCIALVNLDRWTRPA